jgi:hypothetical protein
MMNKKQRESFEAKSADIKRQRQETFSRQAIAGTGTVLAGGYIRGKTKNQPGEGTVTKPTTTTTASTTREPVSQPKADFVPWRERKFPADLSARKDDGVAKGVTQRSSVSDSPKGIRYKDVRFGRATAMQEMKARSQRARKARQDKRIASEMSKPAARQPAKSVIDFKPNFQATQDYFKSLQKAPTPSPRAEVDTESYKPRPGSRMGIGKYEAKEQVKAKEVKAPTPIPTKKPVRSDYPDTTSYMAAGRAYRQALMAKYKAEYKAKYK